MENQEEKGLKRRKIRYHQNTMGESGELLGITI